VRCVIAGVVRPLPVVDDRRVTPEGDRIIIEFCGTDAVAPHTGAPRGQDGVTP
jgi:hypothetical protein